MQMGPKHPLDHRDEQGLQQKGKRSGFTLAALPLTQPSPAPQQESPTHAHGFSSGEGEPKVDHQAMGGFLGDPLQTHLTGFNGGTLQGSATGDQRGQGLHTAASAQIHVATCSGTKAEIPASGSANLQSSTSDPIRPESSVANFA